MKYKLEYISDEEVQAFYLNKDIVTAGKLRVNDLQLNDRTVSRNHCKFIKSEDTYKLVDCNSTNGTYVNGYRITEKILNPNDNIAIGRTILKYISVSEEQKYYDVDDQKISMVVPLLEDFKVEKDKEGITEELNFLTALTKLGKNLIASTGLEDSFDKVGELIFEILKPKRVFIFFYNTNQQDLDLKYSRSDKGGKVEKVNISKTIAMKAIGEKVAILSSNTRDDARFEGAKSVILYGITSAISIPIWTKNSIYGLIYVDTTQLEQMFTQKDLEILSTIANFTGLSIEGINNLEKLDREKKLRSRLERYHSPAVVSKIMERSDDATLGLMDYKESEASVLFMDIVGFTPKVENMNPVETGMFLNNFFTEMTDIIFKYNGTLDKYIGDAIMAVFGVPFPVKNHTELAILAALDMQKKAKELNLSTNKNKKIQIRIGINSGKLISGDFGSPKRFDYTVLGNTVNIASRLESTIAKPDEIVISEASRNLTKDLFQFEFLGAKKLQGISKEIKTYQVIDTVADTIDSFERRK